MMKVQDSKSHLLLLVLLASVAFVSAGWNSCAKNPCRNGGTCEGKGYGYLCLCASGWTGSSCEQPMHPCVPNPCIHGGCCAINSNTDYRCDCDKGWTGRQCDKADDPCKGSPNPCGNHGDCYLVSKNSYGYLCKCYLGWYGKTCDKACSAHCAAGCASTGPGRCDGPCDDGYELTLDLECVDDPCNPNPCRYGGTCKADGSSYTCTCKYSYSGPNCETHVNPCDSSPCLHDGTCRSDGKTYTCSCSAEYTGTRCETQINPCDSSPCLHDGTCRRDGKTYTCSCSPGYTGTRCETQINPCFSRPCKNNGTCFNELPSYRCECPLPYFGRNCEERIDCNLRLVNPNSTSTYPTAGRLEIFHNGTWGTVCDDFFNNAAASVACACLGFGKVGIFVFNRYGAGSGQIWLDDVICNGTEPRIDNCSHRDWGSNNCIHSEDASIDCTAVPPCSIAPCQNSGTCSDFGNDYTCICLPGYTGRNCESRIAVSPCSATPCRNNGTCSENGNGYTCSCLGGYTGRNCETRIAVSHCSATPCLNNGTCSDNGNGYTCSCLGGYTGRICETRINCDLRLINPNSTSTHPTAGRLEIFHSGTWGTICDDLFTDAAARVACACLGFGRVGRFTFSRYGAGSGQIWLDNVECNGTEQSVSDCTNSGWGVNNCVHTEDVSIDCSAFPPCPSTPCLNNGICSEFENVYRCICLPNYTGRNCETRIRRGVDDE